MYVVQYLIVVVAGTGNVQRSATAGNSKSVCTDDVIAPFILL